MNAKLDSIKANTENARTFSLSNGKFYVSYDEQLGIGYQMRIAAIIKDITSDDNLKVTSGSQYTVFSGQLS